MRAGTRLTVLVASIVFLDIALWSAIVPLLPRWQHDIGLGKGAAGLVVGTYGGAVLVAALPVGRFADRVGPRSITVVSTGIFAASIPLLGAVDAVWQLIAVRALQGLCSAVSWTAGVAWLAASVPSERRGSALGTVNGSAALGALVGPALGGPLVTAVGLEAAMLAIGACMLAAFGWTLFEPGPPRGGTHEPVELRRAARMSVRDRSLRAAYVGILYVSVTSGVVQVLGPLHLSAQGLSDAAVGWAFTAAAAVGAAVTFLAGRLADRVDRIRLSLAGTALLGGAVAILAVFPASAPYVLAIVLESAFNAVVFVVAFPLTSEGAERTGIGQGSAIGALNALWALGALVSPVGAAALARATSDALAYGLTAAAAGLALAGISRR
jgi:MFS transporter, DHA1 family, solute carrier family 18 (vesicular amine transporter), member 1/2